MSDATPRCPGSPMANVVVVFSALGLGVAGEPGPLSSSLMKWLLTKADMSTCSSREAAREDGELGKEEGGPA